jgi:hypothetical protein
VHGVGAIIEDFEDREFEGQVSNSGLGEEEIKEIK